MTKRIALLPLIVAFGLPVLLYLQTLGFGFTWFDDDAIILKNVPFLSDVRNAPKVFLDDAFLLGGSHSAGASQSSSIAGIFYRPLQTLSFMADVLLSGGSNPWMFHLTNTLLLGLITCLLFLFFRTFSIPSNVSLLSALLYSIHPLFTSSVAWIPARGDLLLLCSALSSFLFFAKYLRERTVGCLLLHWLTFTVALFCKETAAFLPFIFILYYFTFAPREPLAKRHLLVLALYGISGIFWYGLRSMAIGRAPDQGGVDWMQMISNLRTIPESLARFILPFNIAPIPRFTLFATLAGFGIMLVIIVLFFANKERSGKEKMFCLSWFLLLLLPAIVYKNEYYDYLNHRFFLPLIGIMLFLLFLIPKKLMEANDTRLTRLMVAAVVVLSSATAVVCQAYADPLTFYNSVISHDPDNALMCNNRGNVRLSLGDFGGAIGDFTRAIELNPSLTVAYYNRGNAYGAKGDVAEAIKDYGRVLELNPQNADACLNRGNAYDQMGEHQKAIRDFDKSIELIPSNIYGYNSRGIAYAEMGQYQKAIADFNRAIELNPVFAEAYINRGATYRAGNMLAEAEQDFSTYKKLTEKK